MNSFNKVVIVGMAGDPEAKTSRSGTTFATLSIASDRSFTAGVKELQEKWKVNAFSEFWKRPGRLLMGESTQSLGVLVGGCVLLL